MAEAFEKVWRPLNHYWEEMDKKKKVISVSIISALILIAVISALVLGKGDYVVLYKDLEPQEAGEILTKLEEMKVDAKPKGANTILVPSKDADKLRMQLSAEGYPKSSFNYDIFQNSLNFGATDFEKQKYLQFQLQERLQNSIKTLDVVEEAIVTLNMPDNSSFVLKEDKQKASASVILKIKGKEGLTKEQIKGIEGLVTKSVPGLQTEEVFIVDSLGNSLKSSLNPGLEVAGEQLELEAAMGKKMQNEIVSLLEPVFGLGKVSAGVRVSLDFDEKSFESLRFDPIDGDSSGIAVSESTASEELNNSLTEGNVGQNPNGGAPQYAEIDGGSGQYRKENRTVNYEVNQIRESVKNAEGQIKDISVSVLLDENNFLPQDVELKVRDIVSGALGIGADKIVVQKMAFQAQSEIGKMFDNMKETNERMEQRQQLIQKISLYGISALLFMIAMFMVIRRQVKRHRREVSEMEMFTTPVIPEEQRQQLELEVKRSEKKALIERSVKKNPELIAMLLRNWLREDIR